MTEQIVMVGFVLGFFCFSLGFSCGAGTLWYHFQKAKLIRSREEMCAAFAKVEGDNEPQEAQRG